MVKQYFTSFMIEIRLREGREARMGGLERRGGGGEGRGAWLSIKGRG